MTSVPQPPALTSVPYAYSSIPASSSHLMFCAGACPLDIHGAVRGDTYAEQAVLALRNLERVLEHAGASRAHLVQLRVLVASSERSDLVETWDALVEVMGVMPPSTLMGVTVLGYAGQLVELEAVAALSPERGAEAESSDGS